MWNTLWTTMFISHNKKPQPSVLESWGMITLMTPALPAKVDLGYSLGRSPGSPGLLFAFPARIDRASDFERSYLPFIQWQERDYSCGAASESNGIPFSTAIITVPTPRLLWKRTFTPKFNIVYPNAFVKPKPIAVAVSGLRV